MIRYCKTCRQNTPHRSIGIQEFEVLKRKLRLWVCEECEDTSSDIEE